MLINITKIAASFFGDEGRHGMCHAPKSLDKSNIDPSDRVLATERPRGHNKCIRQVHLPEALIMPLEFDFRNFPSSVSLLLPTT